VLVLHKHGADAGATFTHPLIQSTVRRIGTKRELQDEQCSIQVRITFMSSSWTEALMLFTARRVVGREGEEMNIGSARGGEGVVNAEEGYTSSFEPPQWGRGAAKRLCVEAMRAS
jgi:hypothetical protein